MYEVVRLEVYEPSYTEGIFTTEEEARKAANWLIDQRRQSVAAMNADIDPDDPDYSFLHYQDDVAYEVFPITIYTDFETWQKESYKI